MAYNIQYSIRGEAADDVTTMGLNIIGTETHSDAVIAAGLMAALIEPMIDGAIIKITLSETIPVPAALRDAPLDTARGFAGLKFSFRTDENHPTYVRVPTRKESMVVDGSKQVDLTATAVVNFLAAMTGGLSDDDLTGDTVFTDTRDEPIATLYSAVEDGKKY